MNRIRAYLSGFWTTAHQHAEPDPFDLSRPINGPRDQFKADEIAKAQARDAEEIGK